MAYLYVCGLGYSVDAAKTFFFVELINLINHNFSKYYIADFYCIYNELCVELHIHLL